MAGVINSAARQIDLRGRVKGRVGTEAIRRVTLNPGFNVVPDEDMQIVLANKANTPLVDSGVVKVGAMRRREDDLVDAEVARREKEVHQMDKPDAVASLIPGDTGRPAKKVASKTEEDDDLALS